MHTEPRPAMHPQPRDEPSAGALRQQFTERQQLVLRALFTAEECEEILRWVDFREGRLRNCFGNPDAHPLLARVNVRLAEVFDRSYTHIQTALHYSSDTSP